MMRKKPVFNIKPVFIIQLIHGFDINIHTSRKARIFSKIYSIILSLFIAILSDYLIKMIDCFYLYVDLIEYFLTALYFLFTNDGYLKYFSYIPTIDNLPGIKKQLRKLEIFSICCLVATFATKILLITSSCIGGWTCLQIYIGNFLLSALEVCKINMTLCFGLLYLRTRAIKKAFCETDFNDSHVKRSAVISFIQMYETLVDTLGNVEGPIKLLVS